MSLHTGMRLGPYVVIAPLGAGGMGEVYRARDERLDRDVAIKVLPASVAADPDRLSRFDREAKAVAALSHPNILALFDTGRADGHVFVVTELLEGETLGARLERGALPVSQSIDIGVQVARGLAAAHDRGVVHRDLKPDNIFLLRDGQVKILDFGLARQTTNSDPELTGVAATDPGTILGTIGYMAPEQARGQQVDARADFFSFGALLYEMLGGRPAFRRSTAADTMTAILTEDPPPLDGAELRVPAGLQRIVERCLAKNREQRFQSAKDLAFALETNAGSSGRIVPAPVAPARPSRQVRAARWAPWFLTAATVVAAVALIAWERRSPAPEAALVSFAVTPPANGGIAFAALSPDGRQLALRVTEAGGHRRLWLRPLDSLSMQPIAGTEDGERPFWSPDGKYIGFFAGNLLKKINLANGAVQVIADVGLSSANGATWSTRGLVLYSRNLTGLFSVPAEGGQPQVLTALDAARHETRHYFPSMLPDGDHFLYVVTSADAETRGLWVSSISKPSERRRLLPDLSQGAYAEGRLLFARRGALMAQTFDPQRLTLSGEAQLVVDNVSYTPAFGFSDFSVASHGALAYIPASAPWRLTWFDRAGRSLGAFGEGGAYQSISISPDGTVVAADGLLPHDPFYELFVLDQARGTTTQLTFGEASGNFPVWSPDGATIAFGSNRAGHYDIFRKPARTSGGEESLLSSSMNKFVMDWSPDGRWLLYGESDPKTNKESLWVLPMTGARKPVPYLTGDAEHRDARFSPDGRFVAYTSDESSAVQVYVETFPAGGGKWQISPNGGARPHWRGDGRELYYLSPSSELMAVPLGNGPRFTPGTPVKLFDTWLKGYLSGYDVSRDGQRFVMRAPGPDFIPTPANVLLNWPRLLK